MMLGRKQDLAAIQRGLFLLSGTMHLFAINGLHIGVVALSLHALLALARCPRPLASTLVLAVLWLDVDTTGESPSAVRAFLMVAVLEAAFILRRPGQPAHRPRRGPPCVPSCSIRRTPSWPAFACPMGWWRRSSHWEFHSPPGCLRVFPRTASCPR